MVAVDYLSFVQSKVARPSDGGTEYREPASLLFPWQREIVAWATRRGRAAVFADCGLGKTLMQLEWARQWGKTLIVCPLAVAGQTIREAAWHMVVLMEEVGELCRALHDEKFAEGGSVMRASAREEAIQVAAVAVAFVEGLDAGRWYGG